MGWKALKQVVLSQVTLKWAEHAVVLQVRTVRTDRAVVQKMSVVGSVAGLVVGLQFRALEPVLGALDQEKLSSTMVRLLKCTNLL
jgi:hypothetical protein